MTNTKEQILKTVDRCDQCGAQAYVLVRLISGELMFCGHHFNKHEEKLLKSAYEVIDEREYLD